MSTQRNTPAFLIPISSPHPLSRSSLTTNSFFPPSTITLTPLTRRRSPWTVAATAAASAPSKASQTIPSANPSATNSSHLSIDTSGASLRLQNVVVQAGPVDLLTVDDWRVMPGERVGIVGPNGCGKSTLLRVISGQHPHSIGTISVGVNCFVGYLPQQAVSGSTLSVWDEAASRMDRLNKAQHELDAAQNEVESLSSLPESKETADLMDKALRRLDDALTEYDAAGGYTKDEKIGNVLQGLGFTESMWTTPCVKLSGGWGMRVALARLLLSEPSVLLLDEPTNHIDLRAKAYLRSFLANYPYSVVIVSHEPALLDTCQRIVEVRGRKIEQFNCGYTKFLEERVERIEALRRAKEKQDAEIDRLQGFIDRFGAKATKATAAKSKQKAIDRIERIDDSAIPVAIDMLAPTADQEGPDQGGLIKKTKMKLRLPKAPPCAKLAITLKNADIGWDKNNPLIRDVSITLERGMRLAILGPNGVGKSTLLKTITNRLEPLNDNAEWKAGDDRVEIGVFTQDLAADLPMDKNALEYLHAIAPDETQQKLRDVLGLLGIQGDASLRLLGNLSGGEKARVALAGFVIKSYNVLAFDEPSNHLDQGSVDVVCNALKAFEGAMVLVSHDRRVIENVATHSIVVENGKATAYFGVPKQALDMVTEMEDEEINAMSILRPTKSNGATKKNDAPKKSQSVDFERAKAVKREVQNAKKKIPKLEAKIEKIEQELLKLEEESIKFGSNLEKLMKIQEQKDKLNPELDALYKEYEELEVLIMNSELEA